MNHYAVDKLILILAVMIGLVGCSQDINYAKNNSLCTPRNLLDDNELSLAITGMQRENTLRIDSVGVLTCDGTVFYATNASVDAYRSRARALEGAPDAPPTCNTQERDSTSHLLQADRNIFFQFDGSKPTQTALRSNNNRQLAVQVGFIDQQCKPVNPERGDLTMYISGRLIVSRKCWLHQVEGNIYQIVQPCDLL
jgi:hypothetical protein